MHIHIDALMVTLPSFSFNTCFPACLLYTARLAKANRKYEGIKLLALLPNIETFSRYPLDLQACLIKDHSHEEVTVFPGSMKHRTQIKSSRNIARPASHIFIPEDACNSTTSPVGLSSVEGPLCPQITQSYIASETCCSDVATSMAISASGDSKKGRKFVLNWGKEIKSHLYWCSDKNPSKINSLVYLQLKYWQLLETNLHFPYSKLFSVKENV